MKQVVFLLADGLLKPSCLFTAIEVFEKANEFYTNRGLPPFYSIRIAGVPLEQKLQNASFSLNAIADIHTIETPDCIILPSFDTPNDFAIRNSREALDWVVRQYKEGAEVASLCTGTFLLAATGLLNGKSCSTHWAAETVFRERFPELDLRTDKIITDRDGVYTAGGATSGLNLVLYLIEKYSGRPTALYCAEVLQIDIDRNSQSPYNLFEGLKTHKDEAIREIQEYIEAKVEEKVTVEDLARHCAMHRINFSRRFKKATQISPVDYIQRVKIEAAKRSLESTRKNVNEVMYSVGYADPKAFRNIFKKVAGVTPQEYKNKFAQHRSIPVS
jgi:transcriptional regulator GlxA family with amidase domain